MTHDYLAASFNLPHSQMHAAPFPVPAAIDFDGADQLIEQSRLALQALDLLHPNRPRFVLEKKVQRLNPLADQHFAYTYNTFMKIDQIDRDLKRVGSNPTAANAKQLLTLQIEKIANLYKVAEQLSFLVQKELGAVKATLSNTPSALNEKAMNATVRMADDSVALVDQAKQLSRELIEANAPETLSTWLQEHPDFANKEGRKINFARYNELPANGVADYTRHQYDVIEREMSNIWPRQADQRRITGPLIYLSPHRVQTVSVKSTFGPVTVGVYGALVKDADGKDRFEHTGAHISGSMGGVGVSASEMGGVLSALQTAIESSEHGPLLQQIGTDVPELLSRILMLQQDIRQQGMTPEVVEKLTNFLVGAMSSNALSLLGVSTDVGFFPTRTPEGIGYLASTSATVGPVNKGVVFGTMR